MHPTLARWFGAGFSIPLSAIASSGIIVSVYLAGLKYNADRCGRLVAVLLLLCFVTSFVFVSTMGLHYRSAKPVLAAVCIAWVFGFLRLARLRSLPGTERDERRLTWLLLVLALIAGLLDRQGAFLVATGAVVLLVCTRGARTFRDLVVGMFIAVIVLQLYNFWLGPALIFRANGYWPDFSYQQIPIHELSLVHQHVLRATALIAANLLLMFGGNWWTIAFGIAVASAVLIRNRVPPIAVRRWCANADSLCTCIALVLASQVLLFTVMIARHGYIYRWLDHRFWYYPLPLCALALCGLLVVMNRVAKPWNGRAKAFTALVLAGLAASNVVSLNKRRDVMAEGRWFGPVYYQCELLKQSLRSGSAVPELNPAYKSLFDFLRIDIPSGQH